MSDVHLPTYRDLLYPTLRAVDALQGSAHKDEIDSHVIELAGITAEQLDVEYPEGGSARGSKVLHRIAFARSSLKMFDALDNSERGVWSLTSLGRDYLVRGEAAVVDADAEMRKLLRERRKARAPVTIAGQEPADGGDADSGDLPEPDLIDEDVSWKAHLKSILEDLDPALFERLCARLLREAGCKDVRVSGQPGDEGIDGVGTLEFSLLSFPVYFQAKRHRRPIGPDKVRELRGALSGRGDKGILITIGTFTPGARDEAQRTGSPIDLINGDRLCELMRKHGLGVRERIEVDESFFEDL